MKIPEIKIVVTKYDEIEEFNSWREFEDWAIDECDKSLYEMWRELDLDDHRAYDGMRDWVRNGLSMSNLEDLVKERGWRIERKAEFLTEQGVRDMNLLYAVEHGLISFEKYLECIGRRL